MPADGITVDVVIPVHNQLELLRRAVETARERGGPRLGKFVFVDDASQEEGIEAFCRANGHYLRNPRPQGFAKVCNRGVPFTTGPYFVLMNSDVEARSLWLEPLYQAMVDQPRLGVVAPLLIYPETLPDHIQGDANERPPGMVQSCGFAINIDGLPYHRLIGWPPTHPKVLAPRDDLQGATGAVWLVRRTAWQALRGFEESFVAYYEDADFCVRAREGRWLIGYRPASLFTHVAGGSFDKDGLKPSMVRNAQLFVERASGKLAYDEWRLV